MNREYYKVLYTYSDREVKTVTYLTGARVGEKEIFCEGQQVYPMETSGKMQKEVQTLSEERVFTETLGRTPMCVLCGAGHVGIPVIRMAKLLGYEVVVIEDRFSFADKAKRAGADSVICDRFAHGLSQIEGGSQVYFIVMTRGHRYDEECLKEILKKPFAYVGMMASRGRAARMKKVLLEEGYEEREVAQIHMPIGLSIRAKTPEEIAVSVLAQMTEIKNQEGGIHNSDKELVERILGKPDETLWVVATIIRRTGSAPRDVGTKMVITGEGEIYGSIGGGCIEAEVIQKALEYIRENTTSPGGHKDRSPLRVVTADMSGAEAEEEGMVCGGKIEVMLEGVR